MIHLLVLNGFLSGNKIVEIASNVEIHRTMYEVFDMYVILKLDIIDILENANAVKIISVVEAPVIHIFVINSLGIFFINSPSVFASIEQQINKSSP